MHTLDPRQPGDFSPWNFRSDAGWAPEFDTTGYHLEATDGSIGKIKQLSHATDHSYLVVDTGPWIFGRTVVLPAGTVTHFDHADRKVYVDRTKEQVKDSPEYDETTMDTMQPDSPYRTKLGDYYTDSYRDRS
jgi:hypothetical protein